MNDRLLVPGLVCLVMAVVGTLPGCAGKSPAATDTSPPAVNVSQPIEREVTDYVEFVGRTEALSHSMSVHGSQVTWSRCLSGKAIW